MKDRKDHQRLIKRASSEGTSLLFLSAYIIEPFEIGKVLLYIYEAID